MPWRAESSRRDLLCEIPSHGPHSSAARVSSRALFCTPHVCVIARVTLSQSSSRPTSLPPLLLPFASVARSVIRWSAPIEITSERPRRSQPRSQVRGNLSDLVAVSVETTSRKCAQIRRRRNMAELIAYYGRLLREPALTPRRSIKAQRDVRLVSRILTP